MTQYLVQLLITIPDSREGSDPEDWNWDGLVNPEEDGRTPVTLLSAVTLPSITKESPPPEFFPIDSRKVGEARFNGEMYDAIAQDVCRGCAFEDHGCDDTRCTTTENPFGCAVIYVKQTKD